MENDSVGSDESDSEDLVGMKAAMEYGWIDPKLANTETRSEASPVNREKNIENESSTEAVIDSIKHVEEYAKTASASATATAGLDGAHQREEPIRFKDAIGRRFSFPFKLCKTCAVSISAKLVLILHLFTYVRVWMNLFSRLSLTSRNSTDKSAMATLI